MIGVYCIENLVNGKCYVGGSTNIKARWSTHRSSLNHGYHASESLQQEWIVYGEENFAFHMLEEVMNEDNLVDREQFWIDNFDSINIGYNTAPNAGSLLGLKRSEETKSLISKSKKGKSPRVRPNGYVQSDLVRQKKAESLSRTYYGFVSPTGEKVIITNLKRFSRDNNLNDSHMYELIAGKVKSHKGWTYSSTLTLEAEK